MISLDNLNAIHCETLNAYPTIEHLTIALETDNSPEFDIKLSIVLHDGTPLLLRQRFNIGTLFMLNGIAPSKAVANSIRHRLTQSPHLTATNALTPLGADCDSTT
jgi:hypothetical protein